MEKLIHVSVKNVLLEGMLVIPEGAKGLVIFAHGSGSSRLSPRNNFVAQYLQKAGLATLLIDLLSKEEDAAYETRFDIALLTERLISVICWVKNDHETKSLTIGLFGASTGAAAALQASVAMKKDIKAVVSRGGRPDLALDSLPSLNAPSLFIVGGNDGDVLALNESAYKLLRGVRKFEIVANATHLFEEPGCLEYVAKVAQEWFVKYLV